MHSLLQFQSDFCSIDLLPLQFTFDRIEKAFHFKTKILYHDHCWLEHVRNSYKNARTS